MAGEYAREAGAVAVSKHVIVVLQVNTGLDQREISRRSLLFSLYT